MTWSAVAEHDRRSFLRASGLAALGVAAGAGLVTACSDDDSAALDDDNSSSGWGSSDDNDI